MCRPLIICDEGVPRVTSDHINRLKAGEWGFSDFLQRGECGFVCVVMGRGGGGQEGKGGKDGRKGVRSGYV